jgi:hypothetical protein
VKKSEIKNIKDIKTEIDKIKIKMPKKSSFKSLAQLNEERRSFKSSKIQSFNKLDKKTLTNNDDEIPDERDTPYNSNKNGTDDIFAYTTKK